MKLTRIIAMAAVVVLGLCLPQAAFADSVWNLGPGLTASADFSASGGTWSLILTFTNTSGTEATLNQVTLDLFQASSKNQGTLGLVDASKVALGTFTVNKSGANGGWGVAIDQKGNNGNSACGASAGSNKGWLCAAGAPLTIGTDKVVFSFGGTYSTSGLNPDTLDLMSNGTINGAKWAVSANAGNSKVQESASLGLLAVGILALGLFGLRLKR